MENVNQATDTNETTVPKYKVEQVVKSKLNPDIKLQVLNVCTKAEKWHAQFYLCRYLSKNFVFRTVEISENELQGLEEI